MESIVYEKTFGIKKDGDKYRVVTNIQPTGRGDFYSLNTDLTYKRKENALKSAERFVRSLHTPFIDFQGRSVKFVFVNMGEI